MRNSRLLVVVVFLQLLILFGQWLSAPGYLPSAQAQVTDPGRDRLQMIDELRSINVKLDKLIQILGSGELQVRVIQPDETKGNTSAR